MRCFLYNRGENAVKNKWFFSAFHTVFLFYCRQGNAFEHWLIFYFSYNFIKSAPVKFQSTFRFFSMIIVYLIAGIVFNKFARHNSGKELVPNVTFWAAVPGLIKVCHTLTDSAPNADCVHLINSTAFDDSKYMYNLV